MNNIVIRKATVEDCIALQRIGRQTFFETFSESNTEEDMAEYLENSFSIEKLIKELNNKYSEFYFAISDEKVIGYLKLNFGISQTELKGNSSLEIERIYILQKYRVKRLVNYYMKKQCSWPKIKK